MLLLDLPPELLCLVLLQVSKSWKRRNGEHPSMYICRLSATCHTARAVYKQEMHALYEHVESVPLASKTRRSRVRERIARLEPGAREWPFCVVPPVVPPSTSLFMKLEWERLGNVAPEWKLVLPPNSDTGYIEVICPHCQGRPATHGFELGRRHCHGVSPFECPGYRIAKSADSSAEATRELGEKWDHYRQRQAIAVNRNISYTSGVSNVPPKWPEPMARPW
jgi:hypothetical protein